MGTPSLTPSVPTALTLSELPAGPFCQRVAEHKHWERSKSKKEQLPSAPCVAGTGGAGQGHPERVLTATFEPKALSSGSLREDTAHLCYLCLPRLGLTLGCVGHGGRVPQEKSG